MSIVVSRVSMDAASSAECLVRMVGKLSPDLGLIFPGKFYGQNASNVIQVHKSDLPTYRAVYIGSLRCTNDFTLDNFLRDPANVDKLYEAVDTVACLFDIEKGKVIEDKDFIYTFAPKDKGPSLYLSDTGLLYTFDFEGWIATTCNMVAMQGYTVADGEVTVTGARLWAALASEYFHYKEVDSSAALRRIDQVEFPLGNPKFVTPDSVYPLGSLNSLQEYAAKNRDKFRPSPFQLPVPTMGKLSLLSITIGEKGIGDDILKRSEELPDIIYPIAIDTLQDYVFSARVEAGKVHISLFDDITQEVYTHMRNLFKTEKIVLNTVLMRR